MAMNMNLRGAGGLEGEGEDPYARFLATDANGNVLQENPTTRVGEVGVGTFIILFLVFIYVGVCCFGSMIKKPGFLYCQSTFWIATIIIFLFEAQRTDRFIQEEEQVDEVDEYFNARLFLLILLSMTSLCSW
ncbi:hypothetical protein TrRE_jg13573 [Triparma retinervis]|jgi:hypothetical protein|uniref:Uncharacterized protein n=1 Tax=Triparma retinervis TaxID=2557542 RepID=A0A9W6ZE91_9STRA|nr:hypothetical protein TrRE_jg13573 [Triparma retinervis]